MRILYLFQIVKNCFRFGIFPEFIHFYFLRVQFPKVINALIRIVGNSCLEGQNRIPVWLVQSNPLPAQKFQCPNVIIFSSYVSQIVGNIPEMDTQQKPNFEPRFQCLHRRSHSLIRPDLQVLTFIPKVLLFLRLIELFLLLQAIISRQGIFRLNRKVKRRLTLTILQSDRELGIYKESFERDVQCADVMGQRGLRVDQGAEVKMRDGSNQREDIPVNRRLHRVDPFLLLLLLSQIPNSGGSFLHVI